MSDNKILITRKRDGEGWRRARYGKGQLRASVIVDDRAGRICLLDSWVEVDKIPNLIAVLAAAYDVIKPDMP